MSEDRPQTTRPPAHPIGLPWPPKLRNYPTNHPALRNEESKEAFNWGAAVEDFGEERMRSLLNEQRQMLKEFRGDWWALGFICNWEELVRIQDPDGTNKNRADGFNSSRPLSMHLESAYLSNRRFDWFMLIRVHLEHADFTTCAIRDSNFSYAHLAGCRFLRSHIQRTHFFDAKLQRAEFHFCQLQGSVFTLSNLDGAILHRADLTGADLRQCVGLRFDENRVRDFMIEGNARDPWSVLRRTYSGPQFFVHAALLVAFALPYIGKVLALTAAGHAAGMLDELRPVAERTGLLFKLEPAWRILVGIDKGIWTPVLGAVLLLYNVLRGVLTLKVGHIRDAEERSGVTPSVAEYMGTQHLREERPLYSFLQILRTSWRWVMAVVVFLLCLRYVSPAILARLDAHSPATFVIAAFVVLSLIYLCFYQAPKQFPDRLGWLRINIESIGLWRLHRLLQLLLGIALVSFFANAICWIWTTGLPIPQ